MSDLEVRWGGPQSVDADEEPNSDAQRKAEERERKKAEVRKRLEESGKAGKKAKKGFLTPERKKKLRKLLMSKAAEDLKRQQLLKDQERQKALSQRTIPLPAIDGVDDKGKLESIYNDLYARLCSLEEEKYDINQLVLNNEQHINELSIEVNDLRGKFVKPTLKKVSKYDNKFKRMAAASEKKEEGKGDFRTNLKTVKKESVFSQIANKKKSEKPEWTKKEAPKKEEKKEEEVEIPKNEPEAAPPAEEPAAEEVEEEEEGEEEEEEEEEE